MPITTGGNYQVLVNNVFYFAQRVVDKLWQGMFNKESKLVVEFIVQLISQVINSSLHFQAFRYPFTKGAKNIYTIE